MQKAHLKIHMGKKKKKKHLKQKSNKKSNINSEKYEFSTDIEEPIKKKENNKKSKKKGKKKNKHPKIKKFLFVTFLIILSITVIMAGILFGMLRGLIKGDWALTEKDLEIAYSNSAIADLDGNIIGTLSGDENRIIISKDEMSEYLPKAFISIEDERFESHHGVDVKRTLGATLSFFTNRGSSSYGGSTITQQVIKNLTGDKEDTGTAGALRKVKEMIKAYQLENIWSKDQIIELYLNLIPLGGDIYGVEMASIKYFNKSANELSLVESAYLAGITNAPSTYNPFGSNPYGEDEAKTKRVNKRVTDVLYKMNQLGKIDKDEYQTALNEVEEGIKFEQGTTSSITQFSYHTEAAINQIKSELMKKYGWTENEAKIHLYGGGYTIYTTQDTNLQKIVENEYANNKDWISYAKYNGEKEQIQSAMVIMDQSTGYVVAGVGALGEKTAWGTNRMVEAGHQPGSSLKPLAVISPSLQEGKINAGTVIDDIPVSYGTWSPKNDNGGYNGLMNIRYILRVSRNIPEVKMLNTLGVDKSVEYLKQYGITTVFGDEGLSLALGGVTHGISPLEMAGGYATIANGGVYIEPTFYTKVENQDGDILIEKEQETHRVISEQNAWIMTSLLKEPTGTGLTGSSGATATGAVISGFQTCGKTGTTNDNVYTWFCGFTPYYTATMYFGYDHQGIGGAPGSGTVARRWASIMKKAHEGLEKATFEKVDGITTATVCSKSGLLATDLCREAGCAYTEYYVSGTAPSRACSTHVSATICEETGLLASDDCTNKVDKICITRANSGDSSAWKQAADAVDMLPTEYCDHSTQTNSETEGNNNENNNQNNNDNNNQNTENTPKDPDNTTDNHDNTTDNQNENQNENTNNNNDNDNNQTSENNPNETSALENDNTGE